MSGDNKRSTPLDTAPTAAFSVSPLIRSTPGLINLATGIISATAPSKYGFSIALFIVSIVSSSSCNSGISEESDTSEISLAAPYELVKSSFEETISSLPLKFGVDFSFALARALR